MDFIKSIWSYIWRIIIVYFIAFLAYFIPLVLMNTSAFDDISKGSNKFIIVAIYSIIMTIINSIILILGSNRAVDKAYVNSNIFSSEQTKAKVIISIGLIIIAFLTYNQLYWSTIENIQARNQTVSMSKDFLPLYSNMEDVDYSEEQRENIERIATSYQELINGYNTTSIPLSIFSISTIICSIVVIKKTLKKIST